MTTSHSNLSLYQIETELLGLLQFREDVSIDPDITPAEQTESLKAIDRQIEEYVKREVAKADGIAAYLRECETRAAALKAEAKRIAARARAWEERQERLETVTLAAMNALGKKKIEGAQSTLNVRKNPASVEVRQPDLVPAEYVKATFRLNGQDYKEILDFLREIGHHKQAFNLQEGFVSGEPSKAAIKEALKRGDSVPGCELVTDKYRLEVE